MTRRRPQRSVTLPPDLWEALERLAKENDRPITRELERAVRQYVAAQKEKGR